MTDTSTVTKRVERAYRMEKRRLMAEMDRLRASYGRIDAVHGNLGLMAFDDLTTGERVNVRPDLAFDEKMVGQFKLGRGLEQSARVQRGVRDHGFEAEVARVLGRRKA